MAAEENDLEALGLHLRHNAMPLLVNTPLRKDQQFPIPRWRPRSGRSAAYRPWHRGVLRLAKALDISVESLEETEPPSLAQFVNDAEVKTESATTRAAYGRFRDAWLAKNTAFYFHLEGSIDLALRRRCGNKFSVDAQKRCAARQ